MKFTLFLMTFLLPLSIMAQVNSTAAPIQQEVLTRADKMPQFPGGYDSLMGFIAKNLQYPKAEKANKVEGIVAVKFIVNTDGTISDITVPRKLSLACDSEAVRITKLFPRFTPGRQGGKIVRVWYPVPFKFILPK